MFADQTKSCCCAQHELVLSILSFTSADIFIKYTSLQFDLCLCVQPYFRGCIVLSNILHQDKKTRVKVKQGSPVAVGTLPEQVDQVGEVRQVTPPTQRNTQIQAEIFNSDQLQTNDV